MFAIKIDYKREKVYSNMLPLVAYLIIHRWIILRWMETEEF